HTAVSSFLLLVTSTRILHAAKENFLLVKTLRARCIATCSVVLEDLKMKAKRSQCQSGWNVALGSASKELVPRSACIRARHVATHSASLLSEKALCPYACFHHISGGQFNGICRAGGDSESQNSPSSIARHWRKSYAIHPLAFRRPSLPGVSITLYQKTHNVGLTTTWFPVPSSEEIKVGAPSVCALPRDLQRTSPSFGNQSCR
ncbi:hypothetical protein WG66_012758, partial [Moniliophthora roreri]